LIVAASVVGMPCGLPRPWGATDASCPSCRLRQLFGVSPRDWRHGALVRSLLPAETDVAAAGPRTAAGG